MAMFTQATKDTFVIEVDYGSLQIMELAGQSCWVLILDGVYFVRLGTENGYTVRRILVQH